MKHLNHILIILAGIIIAACSNGKNQSDAYGNFEADEIIISSEVNGTVVYFSADEGSRIDTNQIVAIIDTTQLSLKREQLLASINAVESKTQDVGVQIDVLEKKKANLIREKNRVSRLLRDSAATQKQMDDIEGELEVIEKQITANKKSLTTVNSGILSERNPITIQIRQIEDQIKKSYVRSSINGIMLNKYIFKGELATLGKPLFKVANLDEMYLKVYISATQLPNIKTGDEVSVFIDKNDNETYKYNGAVSWISDKAEFTPKIIQTKEERVNLVYALKIIVKNDGKIKIGMPGEVRF